MKKIALAAVLAATASTAFAGNMAPPVMEAPVIVEETQQASSASAVWVPLILLALVAAAAAD